MFDLAVREQLRSGVRLAMAPVGEFIHVSAIYLGLAVLTTLGLSLVLPSMRQQSQQLHEVVLTMFQANDGNYGASDDAESPDWTVPTPPASASVAAPPSGPSSEQPSGAAPAPEEAATATGFPSFTQALVASMQDRPVKGLTRAQDHGLRSYLARKYRIAPSVAGALIRTAFSVGRDERVDPQLLLAVIAIESRYNPFVESAVGAQGLMQIMTNVHRDKLKRSGGRTAVFNPVMNIRVGAQILSDCIKRRGSLEGGLACYVGATGAGDGGYGARVLAERRRIALASGLPPGR
ncbi:MAG TPA: lytic transglycosylase domain-containing protein [Castellaniella sp.]|uniref:lytic transglycosylase domain-containing protein n=1 Tax=Castellaniella sp. TaxID=1955812 RepID=UPI002F20C8EC